VSSSDVLSELSAIFAVIISGSPTFRVNFH